MGAYSSASSAASSKSSGSGQVRLAAVALSRQSAAVLRATAQLRAVAATADGTEAFRAAAPKPLSRNLRRLRKASRSLSRKQINSGKRKRARAALGRLLGAGMVIGGSVIMAQPTMTNPSAHPTYQQEGEFNNAELASYGLLALGGGLLGAACYIACAVGRRQPPTPASDAAERC